MTALQDWLSIKPVDPVKTFIRDALRTLTADEPAKAEEPQLLQPGVERC